MGCKLHIQKWRDSVSDGVLYKRTGVGLRRISMIGTDLEEAVYKTVIALNRARHLQNVVDIPSKLLKREKSNTLSSLADLKD